MNSNFRDMLFMLADENADFLIVGAYASSEIAGAPARDSC